MTDRKLLEAVSDRDSLTALLQAPENQGGLGWPVDPEAAFSFEPEITAGVQGNGSVEVRRLVPASVDEPYLILLAEFEKPYLRRDLRELLTSLRRHARETGRFEDKAGTGDTIFIVASPKYEDVRFVLFEEREKGLPKIRSFGWRKEFIGRTVLTHNLDRLTRSNHGGWLKAWDVEGLTDAFYIAFEDVFKGVAAAAFHPGDDDERQLSWALTQQLFNRLLFTAFIDRMGWLEIPGQKDASYLSALYARHVSLRGDYRNVRIPEADRPSSFMALLGMLFHKGLDSEQGVQPGDELYPLLGRVEYLNGGLFALDQDLEVSGASIPDENFGPILGPDGLFNRFNFTVTESTPLDQEVAVDPEMLGKIFERLVNDRHQEGKYYTPRPIVSFMVDESLKAYLIEGGLSPEKAELLVTREAIRDPDTGVHLDADEVVPTRKRLMDVRVVDPACGSGAYLLATLSKIFTLVDLLMLSENSARAQYLTKLEIMQRCVFGVDLDPTAISIARLRLWLSLAIENAHGQKPEPLPYFNFRVIQGDALAVPIAPTLLEAKLRTEFAEARYQADRTHGEIRDQHLAEVDRLRAEIEGAYGIHDPGPRPEQVTLAAAWDNRQAKLRAARPLAHLSRKPFDWCVEFAEVFAQRTWSDGSPREPGFDIVLANPPYVNSGELLKTVGRDYKDALVKSFPNTSSGTADLLVYFFDRAIHLLRPGGQLAFITSNKWLKAGYGKKLRAHLAARTHLHHLIDFRDLPVFQGTIAYPLITTATKSREGEAASNATRFTSVASLSAPYPNLPAITEAWGGELSADALGSDGTWRLETGDGVDRLAKMRSRGTPLGEYVNGRIYRGILTGLNEVKIGSDGKMYGKSVPKGVKVVRKEGVFVIDGKKRAELIAEDPKSEEIIKPLIGGRDIWRWRTADPSRWLIVTKIGTPMDRYPAVMKHLHRYEALLRSRQDQGDHWWELRACAYWGAFERPKLVCQDLSIETRWAVSPPKCYVTNTGYIFGAGQEPDLADLFLLGVLNSSQVLAFYKGISPAMQGGFLRFIYQYLEQIPIPSASAADRAAIEALVQQILDIKAADPAADVSALEAEIDARVEFLYFKQDEAPTYDEWIAQRQAEQGTIVKEVRKLISQGESAKVEFKETLEAGGTTPEHKAAVFTASLRAICSLINKEGGTLLIGVHDTNGIIGLERDGATDPAGRDRFLQRIAGALKNRAINYAPNLIGVEFAEVDSKWIAVIRVKATKGPKVLLDGKLYIRDLTTTVELDPTTMAYLANTETDEP